jgi:hypothetical protein
MSFIKLLVASSVREDDRIFGAVLHADDALEHLEREKSVAAKRCAKDSLRAEQQAALHSRALARARARRASIEAPREARPPWEWLPPPPPASSARAGSLAAALSGALSRAPGVSGAQAFHGELGAMPTLRRLRTAETAADLAECSREARVLRQLEAEDRGVYAAAERERNMALLEAELRDRTAARASKAAWRGESLGEVRHRPGLPPPPQQQQQPHSQPPAPHSPRKLHRSRQRRCAQHGCKGRTRPRWAAPTRRLRR